MVYSMNRKGANAFYSTGNRSASANPPATGMEIDKTTLADLSIFNGEEDISVFSKLDNCRTIRGREKMYQNFMHIPGSIDAVEGIQQTLQFLIREKGRWPGRISNGSIMVIERFYETAVDAIPDRATSLSSLMYKFLHGPDFSLVKYSTGHCFEFIKDMQAMVKLFLKEDTPAPMKHLLELVQKMINKEEFNALAGHEKIVTMTVSHQLNLAHFIRYRYKQNMLELIDIYAQLDAWYGMAESVAKLGLVFPEFIRDEQPRLTAGNLYHILLSDPVDYDVLLSPGGNFMFLTGANMAGKSTFIKAVGTAVYLAHMGMGVPAKQMTLSYFDGLLSNINVVDNIIKGESFFYNEVQRIKATISKVSDGRKWLILVDELFKGTNVQDAMKCSSTVIEGLLKIRNSFFILSTHLYEIGEDLKKHPNIIFRYFETSIRDEQLHFSYQLKEGISNDRLGYLILKREGVVQQLESL